jgi:hypothetical protein
MFVSWHSSQTKTSLEEFRLTPELRDNLKIFCPRDGQTAYRKMYEIADDLIANVTQVWGRQIMHIGMDICFHSGLEFDFLGTLVDKGWVEMMIIGDSRTGKTHAAKHLVNHYHAGTLYSCDQASLAGLVGGVHQPNGGRQWQMKWGAIPLNDRRLMVLDEAQSLVDKGIIENMSGIRSSGIAEVTKIEYASTTARTRLLWIANPPNGAQLRTLPDGGMDGLRQMMPAHEDIARFDFAMAAGSDEVPTEIINSANHRKVKHVYSSELCAALVMWAWSRRRDQIKWEPGAERYLLKVATALGRRYVATVPLIQPENVRIKLARMAVAIAARTFSSDHTGECLIVRRGHIRDAARFLHQVYNNDLFGYGRMSQRAMRESKVSHGSIGLFRDYFLGETKHPDGNGPAMFLALGSMGGRFELRHLAEAAALPIETVNNSMRTFMEHRLIRRGSGGKYLEISDALTQLLRDIEDEEEANHE